MLFKEVVEVTTFVLVHGAFGSAAELAPVIFELETLGHRAIAIDLPCTDPAARLDDYAGTVADATAGIQAPIVVVGDSSVSHDDGNGCRSFDMEMLAFLHGGAEHAIFAQRPRELAALLVA